MHVLHYYMMLQYQDDFQAVLFLSVTAEEAVLLVANTIPSTRWYQ